MWDISQLYHIFFGFAIYPTRFIANLVKIMAIYRVKEGLPMNTKKAVAIRILQLCNEKQITVNALANIAGLPPSTIYSMLNEKSQNPGVVSIKKICDGLDITIREFFNNDIFDGLEQEIK